MNTNVQQPPRPIHVRDALSIATIAGVLVSLVLAAILVPAFVRITRERQNLQAELATTQQFIAQIEADQAAQPEILQQRIAEAKAELATLLRDWPATEQAPNELARCYQIASQVGVQLVRVEAAQVSPMPGQGTIYQVERFMIEARGEIPNLLRFFGRVGTPPSTSLILDNIAIKLDHPSVGQAYLTIFSSDLGMATARPEPAELPVSLPSPTPPSATPAAPNQESEALRPEALTPTVTSTPLPTTTPQPQTLVYTVRRGDTLSSIASRYSVSVQEIMSANNLRTTRIYVGQQLIIPVR